MPHLTIATWNINSVRVRLPHVARFVDLAKPDVLCLQEVKCRDGEFPINAFKDLGLRHVRVVGQKGWHGVAIASRYPLELLSPPDLCMHAEARAQTVRVKGIEIHNLYVPAGGEEYDLVNNAKFQHKLNFLERMKTGFTSGATARLLVGDLNVAPGENDVWNHKQLLSVISHTPEETERFEAARQAGGFVDIGRTLRGPEEKLYTWWSYRNHDWRASNRGRRLDHIWASADLAAVADRYTIHDTTRDWEKPSDHAPVTIRLAI